MFLRRCFQDTCKIEVQQQLVTSELFQWFRTASILFLFGWLFPFFKQWESNEGTRSAYRPCPNMRNVCYSRRAFPAWTLFASAAHDRHIQRIVSNARQGQNTSTLPYSNSDNEAYREGCTGGIVRPRSGCPLCEKSKSKLAPQENVWASGKRTVMTGPTGNAARAWVRARA